MTEEAILKGCLQNEPAAQRELYNRYSPKMLSVCYRFAHNREDAERRARQAGGRHVAASARRSG